MPQTLSYTKSRIARLLSECRHLPLALRLLWTAAGRWTLLWLALLLLQGVLPVALVSLTRALVNAALAGMRAGASWAALQPALRPALFIAAILLLIEALRGVATYVRTVQAELLKDHISSLVHQASTSADLSFYESPDFYDHLHRAMIDAETRPVLLVEALGSLLQNGVTLAAMGAVLLMFGPWLPLALLLCTLPALYVVLNSSLRRHEFLQEVTAAERQTWYYKWLLTSGESAAEIRVFGLAQHFDQAFRQLRSRIRSQRLKLVRGQVAGELWAAATALAITAVTMGWMSWRALRGLVTLGDLALFYQAFLQGSGLARALLGSMGQLYENALFLGVLCELLALKPRVAGGDALPVPQLGKGICFENVSFRYAGASRPALHHFDLTLRPNELVALVGPNGAGKSTVVKLLTRLYEPDEGVIRYDGVPLTAFAPEELRTRISVLFQDAVRFNATAAENIRYGDLQVRATETIKEAAVRAGADAVIARLPHGLDTLLGRAYLDGVELSVGEWQRIALGRTLLRDVPIVVLDEPTSAMDPWAEVEWLPRLRDLARGCAVLLITHRFTTAMCADRIHVMAEGRVVECGSHSELLAREGLYARGWALEEQKSTPSS